MVKTCKTYNTLYQKFMCKYCAWQKALASNNFEDFHKYYKEGREANDELLKALQENPKFTRSWILGWKYVTKHLIL